MEVLRPPPPHSFISYRFGFISGFTAIYSDALIVRRKEPRFVDIFLFTVQPQLKLPFISPIYYPSNASEIAFSDTSYRY